MQKPRPFKTRLLPDESHYLFDNRSWRRVIVVKIGGVARRLADLAGRGGADVALADGEAIFDRRDARNAASVNFNHLLFDCAADVAFQNDFAALGSDAHVANCLGRKTHRGPGGSLAQLSANFCAQSLVERLLGGVRRSIHPGRV